MRPLLPFFTRRLAVGDAVDLDAALGSSSFSPF